MKRLTHTSKSGSWGIRGDIDDAVLRLAAIEDILGDEYDLDRLRELVQADREGRCVVIRPNSVTKVSVFRNQRKWKDTHEQT